MLTLLLSAPACAVAVCEDGEHIYSVELVQAATGDADGLRRYTCDVCGYSYDEVIPATGHHWGEWVVDDEPGCTESGHRHCVCEACGDEKSEELPALGHDYVSEEAAPTCTENGITTYTCSRCGDSFTETVAAAAGHDYQPGKAQKAEAGKDGWQEYTCTRCGDSYRDIIPALPEETAPSAEQNDSASEGAAQTKPQETEPETEPAPDAEPDSEPEPVSTELVETGDGEPAPGAQTDGGINTMDVVFACGIAATAAGFSLLSAPYIKVLSWEKKKKREIDSRRKEL